MNSELAALLLRAIALVESGADPRAVGAHGERGQFQMSPAVVASCGGHGEREAARHLHWLERQLAAKGVALLPFNLALAWNAGASAATSGRAPISSYEYARRVESTMERLKQEGVQ